MSPLYCLECFHDLTTINRESDNLIFDFIDVSFFSLTKKKVGKEKNKKSKATDLNISMYARFINLNIFLLLKPTKEIKKPIIIEKKIDKIVKMFDSRFFRMWEFYLLASKYSFVNM